MGDVDLSLATDGYLRAPDGRLRYVPGLERIARDTVSHHVRVEWGEPIGGEHARAYWCEGIIVLCTALFDAECVEIRQKWSHELGHAVAGQSERKAHAWQRARYHDLLSV